MELPHRSYLHPMIHTFKKNGKIVKQVLCYNPAGKLKVGKANHRYDPETCGWQGALEFMYIGPVLCCRRCHRHIWGKESYEKCPQCHRSLGAQPFASHSPSGITSVPDGGVQVASYSRS